MKPKDRAARILVDIIGHFKHLRQTKGYSHEALARRAGISRPAISYIESGRRKPSLMIALKLAEALETELSEIIRRVEQEAPKV